jgi:hypothetical protein
MNKSNLHKVSWIKLLCLLVLALHALPSGIATDYLETFLIGPAIAIAVGYAVASYWLRKHGESKRATHIHDAELSGRILTPSSLICIGLTLFVVIHNIYVGPYDRFEWLPVVLGLLLGCDLGAVAYNPKSESSRHDHAA